MGLPAGVPERIRELAVGTNGDDMTSFAHVRRLAGVTLTVPLRQIRSDTECAIENPSSRAADDTQAIQVLDEIALAHPLAKGDMVFAIMRNPARPPNLEYLQLR